MCGFGRAGYSGTELPLKVSAPIPRFFQASSIVDASCTATIGNQRLLRRLILEMVICGAQEL